MNEHKQGKKLCITFLLKRVGRRGKKGSGEEKYGK